MPVPGGARRPAVLYFPLADIDVERHEGDGRRQPVVEPPPDAEGTLAGFGAFDQDRVRIEVSDGSRG